MRPIPRRQFVKEASLAGIAGLGGLALALSSCGTRRAELAKPNVLFISKDDLNDWFQPLGGQPRGAAPTKSECMQFIIP